jgi:hypothetical protein
MENRESKTANEILGVLNPLSGAFSGITLQKNGVIRARRLKVKRPNQYKGKSEE